ncbi:MAG: PAS domain S-box protein [Candidatus Moranbacteria bacterium]|jgi:PAS domain S-box-containing protein|nr:PAS domain S-box protein [Candidatus Moranbacteria bacterium]
MKLRAKVFLIVSTAIVVLLSGFFGIIYTKLKREFDAAQRDDAASQIETSLSILNRDTQFFAVKLVDWAQWDDTYDFMESRDQSYIDSNLNDESLRSLGIQLVLFFNNDGQVFFQKQITTTNETETTETALSQYFQKEAHLQDQTKPLSGFISVDGDIFLLATHPIVKSDGSGMPRGTLYFVQRLQQEYFDEIGRISRVQFRVQSSGHVSGMNSEEDNLLKGLSREQAAVLFIDTQQKVFIARYFPDIFEESTLVALLHYDGHIVKRGLSTLILFGKIGIFLSVIFVIIVFLLTESLILRKLLRLEKEVKRVADADSIAARVTIEGSDEFASLGKRINEMLMAFRTMTERTIRSESRFDVIANLAPVMIWMTNADGEYIYTNKSAQKFLSQVVGKKNWKEGVFIEDLGMRKALIEEAQSKKRAFRLEYRMQKQPNGYIWVSESAVPHITSDGRLEGYLGVVMDIHKEKEIQIQSKVFTRELEEMNDIFVMREEKMAALKEEVNRLKKIQEEKI